MNTYQVSITHVNLAESWYARKASVLVPAATVQSAIRKVALWARSQRYKQVEVVSVESIDATIIA